jgi:(1->4)-alpha-D-glucan 1-alpha-D-glucosylmutase
MNDIAARLLSLIEQETARRRLPESTYRLQFHADFRFMDGVKVLPYLRDLGITDCYASPYLKARPGSRHGYDITDHTQVNPEVGSPEEYRAWVRTLRELNLGQVLDVVPNHMAVVGNANTWWNDILENGPASPYSNYFDIAWTASPRPELQGRVLIPILGDTYAKALEAQQIRLVYSEGAFTVHYFEHCYPIAPRSYGLILGHGLAEIDKTLGSEDADEYQSILTAVKHLPRSNETDPTRLAERRREKEVIKRRLADLTNKSPQVRQLIERTVARFNGEAGVASSFNLLEELLDDQLYRLAYWRVAADEINYRRFFDINELAALSMEREEVFAATHRLLLEMIQQGDVSGLRIDHPDGLYNPKEYLERLQTEYVIGRARQLYGTLPEYEAEKWIEIERELRQAWAEQMAAEEAPSSPPGIDKPRAWPLLVVVEKILGADEALPASWPIYGTSGYDFLNLANGLFVAAENAELFTSIYRDYIHDDTTLAEIIYRKKILILQIALSGELQMLSYQLDRLAQRNRRSRDFTHHSLRQALREIIACFPVYRSYITDSNISDADRKHVLIAVRRAMLANPALSTGMFHFVRDMLLLRGLGPEPDDQLYQAEQRRFVGKFQQVTAPVMAKGVEDTTFYVYNRLLSLNEVGGEADLFGRTPAQVHEALSSRQVDWPWSFSASSTHDTKRSEDVRARLNVLSEMPEEWQSCLLRWSKLNQTRRLEVDEAIVPDANEEYFLYQTLLGAWPIEPCSPEEFSEFVKRIQAYMRKALQEAKVHTSWINPNSAYDEAVQQFVAAILDPAQSGPFLDDFRTFQQRIAKFGMINSLAQTLIKLTAPGVADFYQGTEFWDFSLVDPDNRRPVDFGRRQQMLQELDRQADGNQQALARELWGNRADGRIKLWITSRGLRARRDNPGLFTQGAYRPLAVTGPLSEQAFAFLRTSGTCQAISIVPRLASRISKEGLVLGEDVWRETQIMLPPEAGAVRWRNAFTGQILTPGQNEAGSILRLGELFADFPVSLLISPTNQRAEQGQIGRD